MWTLGNQKMSNFHFDLSLKLSQGEVLRHFSGKVQNDLRGGVHLHTPSLKIRPCLQPLFSYLRYQPSLFSKIKCVIRDENMSYLQKRSIITSFDTACTVQGISLSCSYMSHKQKVFCLTGC
jgi:hypothetical protein